MKKYFFTLVLCICASAALRAQSGTADNLQWNISGDTLSISGTGDMPNYKLTAKLSDVLPQSTAPWSLYGGDIAHVDIGAGVKSIGKFSFCDCAKITSITVDPDNSVYSSEDGVLFSKDKTTLINFPYSKTGSYAIPNTVTIIGDNAFTGCSGLTSVVIPASTKSISISSFGKCIKLTSITVDPGNTAYSSENGILFNKNKTVLVDFPSGKNGSYTIQGTVKSIGDAAFSSCNGLTSVIISNSVTSIGKHSFSNCSSLTSVTIGNSVTSIGDWAFAMCESLTKVVNLSATPQSISFVFIDVNKSACTLRVPAASLYSYKNASGWKDFKVMAIAK